MDSMTLCIIQRSNACFVHMHMQNYGEDDQQQASMVFGAK